MSGMNRRELLAATGAVALSSCNATSLVQTGAAFAPDDPFAGARLMADVETYVAFGTHRTGSRGDLATSDWLAADWRRLGYGVEQVDVEAPNADTLTAQMATDGEVFEGFAQPPLSFTQPAGLSGKLARWNGASPSDVAGRIAYIHIPIDPIGITPSGAYRAAYQQAASAGAIGIVAAMSGPSGKSLQSTRLST